MEQDSPGAENTRPAPVDDTISVEPALISVIIPAYNCRRYLSDAIESVLRQTYRATEIIVIDDGSTDGTGDVARLFGKPVSVTRVPHGGESVARNEGILRARGDLIAFLDADDLWLEDKLTEQKAALDADPALDLVFAHVEHFVSPELDLAAVPKSHHLQRRMPGLLPSLMLARRSAFDRAGRFEGRWTAGPFIDWYLRAMEVGLRSAVLPSTLAKRRIHGSNSMRAKSAHYVDYVRLLKASLDRRRTAVQA